MKKKVVVKEKAKVKDGKIKKSIRLMETIKAKAKMMKKAGHHDSIMD